MLTQIVEAPISLILRVRVGVEPRRSYQQMKLAKVRVDIWRYSSGIPDVSSDMSADKATHTGQLGVVQWIVPLSECLLAQRTSRHRIP